MALHQRRTSTTRSEEIPESGTVSVLCSLPNGLLLRLFRMEEDYEDVLGGGKRKVERAVQTEDEPVRLNGWRVSRGEVPHCLFFGDPVNGPCWASTPCVDAQFMREWFKQNTRSPAVLNGQIKVFATDESSRDWVRENERRKSGLEPLNMSDPFHPDARVPKGITKADHRKVA